MSRSAIAQIRQQGTVPVLLVLITIGMTLYDSAQLPVLEDAICREYYLKQPAAHIVPYAQSELCGNVEVQTRLASMKGWLESLAAAQGLILTLPYAWLAESMSKRPLLLLGLTTTTFSMLFFFTICSYASTLSLTLVVFARLLECVGGGSTTAYIILYSLLAGAVPAETRAPVFYLIGAGLLLSRACTMALCGALLEGFPSSIGPLTVFIYGISVPTLFFSSGGMPQPERSHKAITSSVPLCSNGTGLETPSIDSADGANKKALSLFRSALNYCKHTLYTAYKEYLGREVFRRSFLICFIKIIGLDIQLIQTQWAVKRYDWTISAATYVNAYAALICMCVLAGLPSISSYLLQKLGSARRMEFRLLQLSLSLRVIGTLAMGLSPNKPLFLISVGVQALSAGTYDTFKSLMSSFSTKHITELFAVVSIIESIARIADSQLWANTLIVSLRLEGISMGLPFWLSAMFTLCALLIARGLADQLKEAEDPSTERLVGGTGAKEDLT